MSMWSITSEPLVVDETWVVGCFMCSADVSWCSVISFFRLYLLVDSVIVWFASVAMISLSPVVLIWPFIHDEKSFRHRSLGSISSGITSCARLWSSICWYCCVHTASTFPSVGYPLFGRYITI